MHAAIFKVTIKDREKAEKHLKEQIVPTASQAPGFVTGHWANVGGDQGAAMVVFESEDAAKQWSEGASANPPPAEIVTIDSVEVGEVVAQA
jgi:heme-degrading monooxygenase HmoA